jgi:hypothetical protein
MKTIHETLYCAFATEKHNKNPFVLFFTSQRITSDRVCRKGMRSPFRLSDRREEKEIRKVTGEDLSQMVW